MLFKDIDIFHSAASPILQGYDTYAILSPEVSYLPPFYFIFIPLVALPAQVIPFRIKRITGIELSVCPASPRAGDDARHAGVVRIYLGASKYRDACARCIVARRRRGRRASRFLLSNQFMFSIL